MRWAGVRSARAPVKVAFLAVLSSVNVCCKLTCWSKEDEVALEQRRLVSVCSFACSSVRRQLRALLHSVVPDPSRYSSLHFVQSGLELITSSSTRFVLHRPRNRLVPVYTSLDHGSTTFAVRR